MWQPKESKIQEVLVGGRGEGTSPVRHDRVCWQEEEEEEEEGRGLRLSAALPTGRWDMPSSRTHPCGHRGEMPPAQDPASRGSWL